VNIYVGNLSFGITSSQLQTEFEAYGTVSRVHLVSDRETGQPGGFGFVEMADASAAKAAIDGLNGKAIAGRNVTVNEGRPREVRRP